MSIYILQEKQKLENELLHAKQLMEKVVMEHAYANESPDEPDALSRAVDDMRQFLNMPKVLIR